MLSHNALQFFPQPLNQADNKHRLAQAAQLKQVIDQGDLAALKTLLSQGIAVDTPDELGDTALHYAVLHGNLAITRFLLSQEADVNRRDQSHCTPLHTAIERSHFEIASLLLKQGANVNLTGDYGQTALHTAISNGNLEIIQQCLAKNPDVRCVDNYKNTPLHYIGSRCLDIVTLLLERGADVNAANEDGRTALHYAVNNGEQALVKKLLDNGGDPRIEDITQNNAIDYAYDSQNITIMTMLTQWQIEYGALQLGTP